MWLKEEIQKVLWCVMENKPKHCRIEDDEYKQCREGDCIKQCGFNCTNPLGFSFDSEWFVQAGEIRVILMAEAKKNEDAVNAIIESINWGKIVRDEVIRKSRRLKREGKPHLSSSDIMGLHCKTSP